MLKCVAGKKDSLDRRDTAGSVKAAEAPVHYRVMSDAELSNAICRAAIAKGHDPVKEGVVASSEVMTEDGSQELAYEYELKANLTFALARQFGVSHKAARRAVASTGTIPLGGEASPLEQSIMDMAVASPKVQELLLAEDEPDTEIATIDDDVRSDIAVYANFIRQFERYDKWLRPFAILVSALAISSAAGISGGGALFIFFMGYGLLCGGFKEMVTPASHPEPTPEPQPKAIRSKGLFEPRCDVCNRAVSDGRFYSIRHLARICYECQTEFGPKDFTRNRS